MIRPRIVISVLLLSSGKDKLLISKYDKEAKWGAIRSYLKYTEDFLDRARIELKRRTSLSIEEDDRFRFLGSFNTFSKEENIHSVEINYLLELLQDECEYVEKETGQISNKWVEPEELKDFELHLSFKDLMARYNLLNLTSLTDDT